jgi:hypothetical protein
MHLDTVESFIYPTDAQLDCSKNVKICIKIYMRGAPTCFSISHPSSGSYCMCFAKVISINNQLKYIVCGPGSVVNITTGYRLDGLGIEFIWGEIFRICPDRPRGPPSLLYNGCQVFRWSKERPGRDANPLPRYSAVVMKELYLYSSYGPYGLYRASVPVQ